MLRRKHSLHMAERENVKQTYNHDELHIEANVVMKQIRYRINGAIMAVAQVVQCLVRVGHV